MSKIRYAVQIGNNLWINSCFPNIKHINITPERGFFTKKQLEELYTFLEKNNIPFKMYRITEIEEEYIVNLSRKE